MEYGSERKMSKKLKQAIFLILCFIAFDIGTKYLAATYLVSGSVTVIPKFFYLTLLYNNGMAFSMLENGRWFFVAATVVILIYGWTQYAKFYIQSQWFYVGGILFFAGTIGNFIERLLFGEVTDFLSFVFGNYHFAIFNFADVFLSMSVPVLLIGYYLFEKELEKREVEHNE